jgi:starch synthase
VNITLHQSEELAHFIYAGADIFIVPSIFEPCGLTQLIALKYGSVPVVRKTGGLADTIHDIDFSEFDKERRNGYTFDAPDATSLDFALDRAIKCWYDAPDKWRELMIKGMNMDFSWNKPADIYVEVYNNSQKKGNLNEK